MRRFTNRAPLALRKCHRVSGAPWRALVKIGVAVLHLLGCARILLEGLPARPARPARPGPARPGPASPSWRRPGPGPAPIRPGVGRARSGGPGLGRGGLGLRLGLAPRAGAPGWDEFGSIIRQHSKLR
jgi:hypothetical protein